MKSIDALEIMIPAPRSIEELDDIMTCPPEAVLESLSAVKGTFAVLGAGGKMGFHISLMLQRGLAECGLTQPVTTVSRFGNTATRQQFEAAGFNVVSADLTRADDLDRLPAADNVFFLAGIKFGTSNNPEMLHQMNVEMPRQVCRRFRDSRFVALSTGCVYSFCTPESGGATESSATEAPGAYAESCVGRESAFVEASQEFGTTSTLIRLNYAIDLRYGVLVDIAQKVLAGTPVNVEMGYANVIWQADAVSHIIQSLNHANSPPFVLNVTGPEVIRTRTIAERFGQLLGRPARIEGVEARTAWLSNAALCHSMFGKPETTLDQMMHWIADWLGRGGRTFNKPTHFEVRSGDY